MKYLIQLFFVALCHFAVGTLAFAPAPFQKQSSQISSSITVDEDDLKMDAPVVPAAPQLDLKKYERDLMNFEPGDYVTQEAALKENAGETDNDKEQSPIKAFLDRVMDWIKV